MTSFYGLLLHGGYEMYLYMNHFSQMVSPVLAEGTGHLGDMRRETARPGTCMLKPV
jgi:hypothetical protein